MPLTISNNSAVASASYYLDKNQKALQMSIKRLASGKRIVFSKRRSDNSSVVMKLNGAVNRLSGAKNNVQNGSHSWRCRMAFGDSWPDRRSYGGTPSWPFTGSDEKIHVQSYNNE